MEKQKIWLEISKGAILSNLRFFRRVRNPTVKVCAVVKANAYGHGLREVVKIIADKVDFFAVDNIDEALAIRDMGVKKPVLIMGYLSYESLKKAINREISFVIYSKKKINEIVSLNMEMPAKVHIKIETGLNRQGVNDKALSDLLKAILKNKGKIHIEGAYTHFANVEDTLDPTFAIKQVEEFKKQLSIVKKVGVKVPVVHCSASAGAMLYKNFNFDMVRIGIGLYGLWPSRETAIAILQRKIKGVLKPVMEWKSVVAQVKVVNIGQSVGYGRTWYALRRSQIAVVPLGYSDGYDRGLSNRGRVIINGKSCPVVGRVAMNMIMVDVTDCKNVCEGDTVTLLGKGISADEIADYCGTINYEIVCRINPFLQRKIIK